MNTLKDMFQLLWYAVTNFNKVIAVVEKTRQSEIEMQRMIQFLSEFHGEGIPNTSSRRYHQRSANFEQANKRNGTIA